MILKEDLAYNLIRYINLGVIKADEYRKTLGVWNNRPIRRERDIIASIMKIFTRESMVRQYKIYALSFEIDMCFLVQKLVAEIDEDVYYYE